MACSVLGCKSCRDRGEAGVSFHAFPKHGPLLELWIRSTGRQNWAPKSYSRLCSKHFTYSCLRRFNSKCYLNENSVPTLLIQSKELPQTQCCNSPTTMDESSSPQTLNPGTYPTRGAQLELQNEHEIAMDHQCKFEADPLTCADYQIKEEIDYQDELNSSQDGMMIDTDEVKIEEQENFIAEQELTIGCDDDSDIDLDEMVGDPDFRGAMCVSRLIDSAMEDAYYSDSNMFADIDQSNDKLLADLLAHVDFDWSSDRTAFAGLREEFTGLPGPTFPVSELAEPVDCFLKMVEPHFVDKIVTETNRYAQTTIRKHSAGKPSPMSRLHRWHPTTQTEIYRFIALLIAQGLYPIPVEQRYWNGNSSMPLFQRTMSYHRFILLKKFLHFNDNATLKSDMTLYEKRLHKIQPVIDYFRNQFKRLYYPHQEVVIDESLLKWKGILNLFQKISTKVAQVDIKTYELCDKNGYLWDFFYYTVSNEEHDGTAFDIPPPTNATVNIVIDLATPLFGKGHTIVMDNFYNSPLLARYLKTNKCDCYGTLRLNRQNVPGSLHILTRANMNPGDMFGSNTKDLTVTVWRDTGLVSMISTYHKPDVGVKIKNRPAMVIEYNKTMSGVDRKDQILSSQPMERSRNLVYKNMFRSLLNAAICNSHILYQSKVPISHRTYREQVMDGLLKRFVIVNDQLPEVTSNNVIKTVGRTPLKRVTLSHRHFPVRSGLKAGRCVWCKHLLKKSRTLYKCRECDVNLCIDFCFESFHTPDQK